MSFDNSNLLKAFPAALREDALELIASLPETSLFSYSFCVEIGKDTVSIPYRIYHDPSLIDPARLTGTQKELLACLMTRHHSGFVREEYLLKILDCSHEWIPPFVVQLVGEYVIDIICRISDSVDRLDPAVYRAFLTHNPAFYLATKQRVLSYWDCYHRGENREDYAGFQVLDFFDRLAASSDDAWITGDPETPTTARPRRARPGAI